MFRSLPAAVKGLLLANIAVFLLEQVAVNPIVRLFALWPLGPMFRPWQLLTYAFIHGGWLHIFFNMFAVFVFGPALEHFWGARRFLAYYFVCVVAAALTQLAVQHLTGNSEPTIGASGGIFGLLLAFAVLFPRARLLLLLPPIPMPAWLFVSLYAVAELIFGVTGTLGDIAHFAHLGGMVGGALMLFYWRAREGRWRPR